MPDRRNQHHEGRNPRQPRAIAVMRARYDRANKGIAENRKRHGARKQREIVERTPEGPVRVRTVPCRFVPLIGSEGFGDPEVG